MKNYDPVQGLNHTELFYYVFLLNSCWFLSLSQDWAHSHLLFSTPVFRFHLKSTVGKFVLKNSFGFLRLLRKLDFLQLFNHVTTFTHQKAKRVSRAARAISEPFRVTFFERLDKVNLAAENIQSNTRQSRLKSVIKFFFFFFNQITAKI